MKLNKVRLGDYIKLVKEKCNISNLTPDDVSGINREKEFFEPSKQVSGDTSNYKIVPPGCFACNIMHVGRDVVLPIALNHTDKNKIVSPAYTVFEWTSEEKILKEYLFMLLKSTEKDRYFWFHCDSSVRDGMDWNAFCDIELEVPDTGVQRKYVAIYNALSANLNSFENGLNDLKLVCDGFIEELRKRIKPEPIGKYIIETSVKNNDNNATIVGISREQRLIPSESRTMGVDKLKYNVVKNGEFAYSPIHINDGSIALNDQGADFIVSPIYKTFRSLDENILSSKYLMLWFSRKEFIRYCWFYAFGSARDTFEWAQLKSVEIPVPKIEIQKAIVEVFDNLKERKMGVEILKSTIASICPILIRGSIEEGQKGVN